jgi:hypothetical protein
MKKHYPMALFVMLLLSVVPASLADNTGNQTVVQKKKALRQAIESYLGKESTYYALRYTYSSPSMPGGIGKGSGVATHLKLYNQKGKYLGTISEGYDGKYHSPTWIVITGTLEKEDAATNKQRFIQGTDLSDIILKIRKQTGVGQSNLVVKAETEDVLRRVREAVGRDWTVTIQLAPQPNPGPAGGARGFVIVGVSKTQTTAARVPGEKQIDPAKTVPVEFWVSAYGPYFYQSQPQIAMPSWEGWSDTRSYVGQARWNDRGKREELFVRLRMALGAHWGTPVNGLRMRFAEAIPHLPSVEPPRAMGLGEIAERVSWNLPTQLLVQNCSNNTIVVLPADRATLASTAMPNVSSEVAIFPSRLRLLPGQTIAIQAGIRKARYPVSNPLSAVPHSGDKVLLSCKFALLKKGDNWKTIKFSAKPVSLQALLPDSKHPLILGKLPFTIQEVPENPRQKPQPATKGQTAEHRK